MMPKQARGMVFAVAALAGNHCVLAVEAIPPNLIVEARVIEARTSVPDYKAMEELSFFINTDGTEVSEDEWLATIARQVPDSFLATLALEKLDVDGTASALRLDKRSRSVRLALDLSEYLPDGIFDATVHGELARSGETQRSFEHTIQLRVGQTFVWSSRDLELSGSEYMSHFRDYHDREHRGKLYERLRDFTTFIVVAYSVRVADEADTPDERVTLELPDDADLPEFESTLGIDLVGTIELELDVDANGTPSHVKVARSSIPELNSQILGEAATWRFTQARSTKGRLTLELEAEEIR